MKRFMILALLSVLAAMVAAQPLVASCSVAIYPNPLVIFSYDWFDPYFNSYVYTQHGSGLLRALSTPPHCVQLEWYWVGSFPLSVWWWRVHFYWSEVVFGYGDWILRRNSPMPFYPYPAAGEFFVFGWDFARNEPFAGAGVTSLTIFQVYF